MSRRHRAEKREIIPDPKFGDLVVTKFMNSIMYDGKKSVAEQIVYGALEIVETKLPCLVTVVKQMNEPRHASLKNVMKARKKEIPTLTAEQIGADTGRCGLNGSPTNVVRVFAPQRHSHGEKLEGEAAEQVASLIAKLREKMVI